MKRPIIEDDLAKRVQDYANKNCDGNFTQAVSEILLGARALVADDIEDRNKNKPNN